MTSPATTERTVDVLPPLPEGATTTSSTASLASDRSVSVDTFGPGQSAMAVAMKADQLPPIEDSNAFLGRPIDKARVLVAGLLKQKRVMVLGASSKVGKTWTLINLGLSIASGQPWLGQDTIKGKVLYLNFELAEDEMQERIQAVKISRCITLEDGFMDVWNLSEHAAPYNVILPAIYERIKTKEYAAIILDPIYCMYGDLDENSAGDVSDLMNALRKLANKSKAAIVFAHHFSKGNQSGKESQDRISGSGVWGRAVDTNVSITAHEEEDAYTVEATPRGFPKLAPFVIRWEYPLMVRDETLSPGKLKTAISKKPVYSAKDLVGILASGDLSTSEFRETVMESTGMSRSMFYRLLSTLEAKDGVTRDEKTEIWHYATPIPKA